MKASDLRARSIDELTEWPSLERIRAAWTESARAIEKRSADISAGELDAGSGTRMPIEDTSTLGLFAFMVQHDSYHLGQLSLLRKHAGLPAMSYS